MGDEVPVGEELGDVVGLGDEVGVAVPVGVGLGVAEPVGVGLGDTVDGEGDAHGEDAGDVAVELAPAPYDVLEVGDGAPVGDAVGETVADVDGDGDASTSGSSATMIARTRFLYASSRGRIFASGTVPFSIWLPKCAICRHSCSSCAWASALSGRGRVTNSCSASAYVRQFTQW